MNIVEKLYNKQKELNNTYQDIIQILKNIDNVDVCEMGTFQDYKYKDIGYNEIHIARGIDILAKMVGKKVKRVRRYPTHVDCYEYMFEYKGFTFFQLDEPANWR